MMGFSFYSFSLSDIVFCFLHRPKHEAHRKKPSKLLREGGRPLEQGESGCTLYVLKSVGNEDAGLNPAAGHIEKFSKRLSVIQGILLYFSNGSNAAVGWGRGRD
jgi:hypothetical protein